MICELNTKKGTVHKTKTTCPPSPLFCFKAHTNTDAISMNLILLVQVMIHCLLGTSLASRLNQGLHNNPISSAVWYHSTLHTLHLYYCTHVSLWKEESDMVLPWKSTTISIALKGKIKARGCLENMERKAGNSNFVGWDGTDV